jgi:hypothetical protein|mmetsp:Transcript_63549/g.104968  ORF Transcript_63549/g.104968 Transcript_63549/m.104968 type:complete len:141 (-) Transcript_63549:562-984(-)|eukprot:CAMPEP_0174296294 /NCGR_PEP_ID=MMETSP0809-20121228/47395_1 /TAXON_ID=73025 ORGANISM="Eutreptiella gymnastica-like, Strain CCMP1594" /NCGR_SAMPLE_ID=MMETSP0809 /ASSEMBLY_ACC=CAM_ASM_000658 /LENGTH=140 /DNA_ID=CAMNT_0015399175 /DNA_START=34 /DNA_END=456 /DNA_ORIENTATION=+
MPIDYSKFDNIEVSDDEEEAAPPVDYARAAAEQAKKAPREPRPQPKVKPWKETIDFDEDTRDRLAEEMAPIVKKLLIEKAGSKDPFTYWLLEVLEASLEPDGRIKCKCDVEHKSQFAASETHFVRTYLYDSEAKAVEEVL